MHIPRAICIDCKIEMVIHKTGQLLEMIAAFGSYYKIYADVYQCPVCSQQVSLQSEKEIFGHWHPSYQDPHYQDGLKISFADLADWQRR
jgi:hypothetical protein